MSHPLLRYFRITHLPSGPLRRTAGMFTDLACLLDGLPDGVEKSVAMRKLLEAKDAAVRAALDVVEPETGRTVAYTLDQVGPR